jgi:CHAT domain-containing protein
LLSQLADLRQQRATIPVGAIPIRDLRVESQKADFDQRINALAIVLQSVETRLWRDYPRFMELLDVPRPVTVEQLQTELLRPGEALLGFVLLPERAVVLAVTRDRFVLHVAPATAAAIGQQVAAIRAGLQLGNRGALEPLERLEPADLHALYRDLIAPVEPVLKDARRVLVVADGPLYSLPLELLITDYDAARQATFRAARSKATGRPHRPPLLGEYADLPYLADRYPFRYLPSLAALASQRRYPKPAAPTTRPLVAFADPVFDPAEATAAAPATRGHTPATQQTLALLTRSGAAAGPLARLPDTAAEARALAAAVSGEARLYLRQDAQERTVKDLSRAGDLKGLRYLLFATHGLLAGEFLPPEPPPDPQALLDPTRPRRAAPTERLGQPALALTLAPARPAEDGLLALKDVIEDLDLDAELVILSACNTAGDSAKTSTGEGFAGLTRAFLFAGARHLWVSHWPVESAAARDLTTAAVRAREAGQTDPAAALAQARKTVRASVVQTPDARQLARAHPFFWAPFVAVGD